MAVIVALAFIAIAPAEFKAWPLAYIKDKNLYVSKGDGSMARLLVKSADTPCWSPDKKKLAFSRGNAVWIVGADGKGLHLATKLGKDDDIMYLSWSSKILSDRGVDIRERQGQAILASVYGEKSYQILVGTTAKSRVETLNGLVSNHEYSSAGMIYPVWDRSRTKLAYANNGDIWMMKIYRDAEMGPVEGVDCGRLAATAEYDMPNWRGSSENYYAQVLSWSLDGKLLAFEVQRQNGSGMDQVCLLNMSKTSENWNHDHPTWEILVEGGRHPSFSANGKWIAFQVTYRSEDEWRAVCAISLDGKRVVRLVKDGEQPCW